MHDQRRYRCPFETSQSAAAEHSDGLYPYGQRSQASRSLAFLLVHGKLAGDVKSIVLSRRLRLRRLPVHRDYFLRTLLVVDASISRRTMSLWNAEQLLAPADVDLAAYVDGNQREVRLKTSIISLILRR